ncbi:MAG: hypothetical protein A2413_07100 [Treponema sp. RIFOXYC1_FULL_61_9]|nr:MAG: hypothetical protein A2413_07100 [Treponema sp. RIFOXYC1_FULL_61_9]
MRFLIRAAFLFVLAVSVQALERDALAVLAEATLFSDAPAYSLLMTMSISGGGTVKERSLSLKSLRGSDTEKTLAVVTAPAFLNKMAFLRIRDASGTRQWLKTSNAVRRLAEGNKNERLFGSDFTAADFLDAATDARSAVFVSEDDASLVAVRAETDDGARLVRFGKADGLVRSVDYFDNDGTLLKRYRVTELAERGGRPYPKTAVMEDLKSGGSTKLTVTGMEDSSPIPDRVFNPNAL